MAEDNDDTTLNLYLYEPDYQGLTDLMIDLRLRAFDDLMIQGISILCWMTEWQGDKKATIVAQDGDQNVIDPDFDFMRHFKPPLPKVFDMNRYRVEDLIHVMATLGAVLKLELYEDVINASLYAVQWMTEKRKQGCALFAVTDNEWFEPELEVFKHFAIQPGAYGLDDFLSRPQIPPANQSRPN